MIDLSEHTTIFKLYLKRRASDGVTSYQRGMEGVEEIVPMTHPILGPVFVVHQGVTSGREVFDVIPASQVISARMVREVINE